MGHWAQNQTSTMAIPALWPEHYKKWVRWTEKKKNRHGAGSGVILDEGTVTDVLSGVL